MKLFKFSLLLFAFVSSNMLFAETGEQSKKFGDYTVYYNAFNSSMLTAKVAHQYGISRSGNNAVINIAVHKGSGETKAAVSAFVSGTVKNLLSQQTQLLFTKIDEGEAIYYIATFSFNHQEDLNFDIKVTPEDEKRQYSVKFHNQFFVD